MTIRNSCSTPCSCAATIASPRSPARASAAGSGGAIQTSWSIGAPSASRRRSASTCACWSAPSPPSSAAFASSGSQPG
ncbi:non-ribosomal peptide synthase domain protein [Burkholderia pseudomallei TSV5]|nr:non-ribosomal peptide synthase domain protein [Burkholderia pseudomallei TSV5]